MGKVKETITNWYEKQDAPVKIAVEKIQEMGNFFKDMFVPQNTDEALYYAPVVGDAKAGANILDSGVADIKSKNYLSGAGKIALAPILTLGTMLVPDGVDRPLKIMTGSRGKPKPAMITDIHTGVQRELTRDDLIHAIQQHNQVADETGKLSEAVIDQSNRQAGYNAIMQKQIRKENLWDPTQRTRFNTPRKKAQVLGDPTKPLLTNTINLDEVFVYNFKKSPESNWNRFVEEMQQYFHFTLKDAEEVFNANYSKYFKLGGKINYLNFFK